MYVDIGDQEGANMTFEVLGIIVFLNVMATITLWRAAARKPPKPKKKFIAALLYSKPIVPKHQSPKTIGEKVPSLVREEDRLFFDDFADFAAVVNWWLADDHVGGPWRLQELPDTELKLDFSDMPDFGRRYAIFHNQVRLGTLEVSPDFRYSSEKPNVHTKINMDWVRLLAFGTVRGLLSDIALHVCDGNPSSREYFQTQMNIDRALTEPLWQTQQITDLGMDGEDWGELELRLDGSANWYFGRRQALHNQQAAA
jgi:hypothetical protein